jgi:hypothetical protein
VFGISDIDISIIEKKIDSTNPLPTIPNNINKLYENSDDSNIKIEFEDNPGTVIINSKLYLCKLDQKSVELTCTTHYLCKKHPCGIINSISNLYVYGNNPSFSSAFDINSDTVLQFSKIRFNTGEFDITYPYDYQPTNICKNIKSNIFSFDVFSVGNFIKHIPNSILCVNIGNECYGNIMEGETKFCDITNVIIKDYNIS